MEFEALRDSGAWIYLKRAVENFKDRSMQQIVRRLWGGGEVTPAEIAHHRGFYEGALWVVSYPEQVADSLERAAEEAWRKLREEELAEGKESPYA